MPVTVCPSCPRTPPYSSGLLSGPFTALFAASRTAFNRVTPHDFSIYKLLAALGKKETNGAEQVIKIVDVLN